MVNYVIQTIRLVQKEATFVDTLLSLYRHPLFREQLMNIIN